VEPRQQRDLLVGIALRQIGYDLRAIAGIEDRLAHLHPMGMICRFAVSVHIDHGISIRFIDDLRNFGEQPGVHRDPAIIR
jgi:hypothetical protein